MKNKGFTLPELLAVIVVLALIIGIALPTYGAVSKNVKNKTYENKKSAIAIAALKYANDANLNNSTKITATKLILDNYYEAEEYRGETPWITDPRDSSKNMACQIIDITLDNHQYYTEVEDNNDCNIAVNEINANK